MDRQFWWIVAGVIIVLLLLSVAVELGVGWGF